MKCTAFLFLSAALSLTWVSAHAKLPAPSDEAKAKSAEAAAKTAHTGKVDGYKLCLAMDRTAVGYQAAAKKSGKAASAPVETPACADPGPFVYVPAVAASAPGAAGPVAVAAVAPPAATKK